MFVRKDFGERHFNIASALILGFFLFLPFVAYAIGLQHAAPFLAWIEFFNFSWLLFIAAFIFASYKHHKTQGFKLTEYDFSKYSLYQGKEVIPWEKVLGRFNINPKLMPTLKETVFEPLVFFIIGIVLTIISPTRAIGITLVISSIIYGLSYFTAYWKARIFMLAKNDERIFNEDIAQVFLKDADIPDLPDNTRIQRPPIMPKTRKQREGIYNQMMVDTIGVV
ncbi:MAG: hypothetical protein Roseis2KO_07240 [Roseivirga sp.]